MFHKVLEKHKLLKKFPAFYLLAISTRGFLLLFYFPGKPVPQCFPPLLHIFNCGKTINTNCLHVWGFAVGCAASKETTHLFSPGRTKWLSKHFPLTTGSWSRSFGRHTETDNLVHSQWGARRSPSCPPTQCRMRSPHIHSPTKSFLIGFPLT